VPDGEQRLETNTGKAPRVSVVIPSYNTASLITNCLDSVFAQTFRDFEAIVVNDGSPDTPQLEEVLRPYQDKIVYIRQQNKRVAGARNTAIRQAQGEFLAFLDSDDSWLPDHLASQMALFDNDPSLDIVYSNAALISESTRPRTFMEKCPSVGPANFESLAVERCHIPISTVVTRKTALIKAGLFDESLVRCDDYDMWLRAAFWGAKIQYGRTVQARLYLGRPDSLGLSSSKMTGAYLNILEKAEKGLPLSAEQKELVSEQIAEIKAKHLLEEGKLQLRAQQPEKARELFEKANQRLHTVKLSLAIRGLEIAPQSACKLIAMWYRLRNASGQDEVKVH
jgi:glycosyltransferase involved in cell wall biosynthesis